MPICPFCEERPSDMPNFSCNECAVDEELDRLLYRAASRARSFNITDERIVELFEAAVDVVYAFPPFPERVADADRIRKQQFAN